VTRAALAAVLACAAVAAAQEPLVVTGPLTITEPTDLGEVMVIGDGELRVVGVGEPGVRFSGSVYALSGGRIVLEDSVIEFESRYHGQYSLVAWYGGTVEVRRCDYRVPSGVQHALIAGGDGVLTVEDTGFGFAQLLAMDTSRLEARRLSGQFECIVQDAATMVLEDIPREGGEGELWVWPEFPAGSRAVYSPPLPGFVERWSFPPPGSEGIPERIEMRRCQVTLWPLLVRAGSDLTLRDIPPEQWMVVGLHLPTSTEIEGLRDGETVAHRELALPDRRLVLENATIDTWNLYPQADARVRVRDCLLGEVIVMERARLDMADTTVDGSGGYFGVQDGGWAAVRGSTFTCDVQATGDGTLVLEASRALPYPQDPEGLWTRFGAYDRARILIAQSEVGSRIEALGQGVIGLAALAPPPAVPPGPGQRVTLLGWAGLYGAPGSPASGGRWRLEAVPTGARVGAVLGEGAEPVEGGELGSWGGADPSRGYELRLVLTDAWGRSLTARWPVPAAPPPWWPRTAGPRPTARRAPAGRARTPH